MKISILGLGYVGAVSAGCLANDGHEVVGVDPDTTKVDLINSGQTPIIEKDIGDMIKECAADGRLVATADVVDAVKRTDISLVCVGTPSQLNGSLDLKYVRKVCEEIGAAIRDKDDFHVIVMRSTMLPGTMRDIVIPVLEEFSGMTVGDGFGLCNNPEFLREGTAVYDYYNPPKTVIGEIDKKSGDVLAELYKGLDAPLIRTAIDTAEMVKYTDNVWHALKIGFANEIGNICKPLGIDGHEVMDIFCKDLKLNLSSYYMKPGYAFGGSCLPKDVRALTYRARSLDVQLPILNAIMPSNQLQIDKGFDMVSSQGNKKIGMLGLSFKAGTDDLRESPLVELVEKLIGKGYDIKIYDENVNIASLVGANRDYIFNHIPHISKLLVDSMDKVLKHGETIIVGNGDPKFRSVVDHLSNNQVVVDLVRIGDQRSEEGKYDGICW